MLNNIIASMGLLIGIMYSVPVIGGFIFKKNISSAQSFMFALGWALLISAKLIF
ncbi:MAG: hypothetical protein WC055_01100 [Melioribacteraceae bacterium]